MKYFLRDGPALKEPSSEGEREVPLEEYLKAEMRTNGRAGRMGEHYIAGKKFSGKFLSGRIVHD